MTQLNIDQCSVWASNVSIIQSTPNQNDQNCSQKDDRYWRSILYYFLIGVLTAGIALAIVLTLYLIKLGIIHSTYAKGSASTTTIIANFGVNLVINGDGETGACAMDGNLTTPTAWNVNGSVNQISYLDNYFLGQTYSTPGPSNRGNCYFMGYQSPVASMWQFINLTNEVDPSLIDSQIVKFNLSAWLGGVTNQDDSVVIELTSIDQANNRVGNITVLGPVLAIDRGNQTQLLPEQSNGILPIGARSMKILVTITRFYGAANNGDVDDIALYLYQ